MIKITSIEPRGFYRLFLRFSDGSEGERDFSDLVAEPGSLAKPLRDPAYLLEPSPRTGPGSVGRTASISMLKPCTMR